MDIKTPGHDTPQKYSAEEVEFWAYHSKNADAQKGLKGKTDTPMHIKKNPKHSQSQHELRAASLLDKWGTGYRSHLLITGGQRCGTTLLSQEPSISKEGYHASRM